MEGITGIIDQDFIDEQVAATATEGSENDFDSNTFLEILMVQLQNQDPYNTMDSQEILAFESTLTQVEQSLKQTEAVDQLNANMEANISVQNEILADIKVTLDAIVAKLDEGL